MSEAWGRNVNRASHRISEGGDLAATCRVSLTPRATTCASLWSRGNTTTRSSCLEPKAFKFQKNGLCITFLTCFFSSPQRSLDDTEPSAQPRPCGVSSPLGRALAPAQQAGRDWGGPGGAAHPRPQPGPGTAASRGLLPGARPTGGGGRRPRYQGLKEAAFAGRRSERKIYTQGRAGCPWAGLQVLCGCTRRAAQRTDLTARGRDLGSAPGARPASVFAAAWPFLLANSDTGRPSAQPGGWGGCTPRRHQDPTAQARVETAATSRSPPSLGTLPPPAQLEACRAGASSGCRGRGRACTCPGGTELGLAGRGENSRTKVMTPRVPST